MSAEQQDLVTDTLEADHVTSVSVAQHLAADLEAALAGAALRRVAGRLEAAGWTNPGARSTDAAALALALADACLEHRLAEHALADEATRRKVGKLNTGDAAEQRRLIARLSAAMLAQRRALDAWQKYRDAHPREAAATR